MNAPPHLPVQQAQQTFARNQFLRAGHQMILPQSGLVFYGLDAAPPQTLSLLMTFSFQGAFEIKIGMREMPFVEKIQALCAPWKLHELPPELARAALTHILNDALQPMPEALILQDLSLSAPHPKNSAFHAGCEIRSDTQKTQLDIFTQFDFPFSELARTLGMQPMTKKIWPPQLYAHFPIDISAADIQASDLSTLAAGDVIFLSPCAPQNS